MTEGTRSDLEIIGLTGILQGLLENKRSGLLYTKSEKQGNLEKYVYFQRGNVRLVTCPNQPSILAEALRRSFEQVDDETLENIFTSQAETGKALTEIILEMGAEEQFIIDLCLFQITEEILELFTWPDIHIDFQEKEPPEGLFREELMALPIELNSGVIMMEAARRLDDWQKLKEAFPSNKDIPYICEDIYEELSEEQVHLLEKTDGVNDFQQILSDCRLTKFTAMCYLCDMLVEKKYLAVKTGTELKEMAALEEFTDDIYKRIRLYERAEELGESEIDTIEWLAEAYESCGLISKTVAKYKQLGEYALMQNNLQRSIDAYALVIQYAPEDMEAHAKYVEVLFQYGKLKEGSESSLVYARKTAVENKEEAIQILENSFQYNPLFFEILEYKAVLHCELASTIDAIFTYMNLANLYKARGLFEETLNSYRKILVLDEANIEARIELANTYLLMGKHEEGVAEYKRLGDILRMSGLIQSSFGFTYLIKVCEKIIQFEPKNLSAREWLADVYLTRKEYDKAEVVLFELLEFLKDGKEPRELVTVLQKLVQIEPENREFHKKLANAYKSVEHLDDAAQELIIVGDLAIEAGSRYIENDEQEKAEATFRESLEAFNEVLEVEPFKLEVRQKKAELLNQLSLIEEAVTEYKLIASMTKAIQQYHDTLTALFNIVELSPTREVSAFLELARICERQQKPKLAVNFYKKYVNCSLQRGDFYEVSTSCRRILSITPNDEEVIQWRDIAEKLK
jgi:tetratricopeptide (TPR) repeat protein